ncbi:putative glycoside hydrolase [Endozoicomonas lisbonensis]|uniref:ExoP galactose-binding-like domain-containing protein n=1 Tax=Endozoicomonas lisbonensis TaxID=3120522 RepID=A0ABV2SB81_9GAMM
MNKTVKSILLGSLSLSMLAGCNSDDSSSQDSTDPAPQPPEVVAEEVVIYGPETTRDFHMRVTNRNNFTFDIPEDLALQAGNMTTQPVLTVDPTNGEQALYGNPVNIKIAGNNKGSVMMTSTTGHIIDLSESTVDGTLQFDLKVNSKPAKGSRVFLTMSHENLSVVNPLPPIPSPTGISEQTIDITGAFNAFSGGEKQTVRVPLACFNTEEHEFDFSQTIMPFGLHSENNLDIDLSNIRFVPNSTGHRYELQCEQSDNVRTLSSESAHNMFTRSNNADIDDGFTGWARKYKTWNGGGTTKIRTEVVNKDNNNTRHLLVTFIESQPAGRGGLLLDPNNSHMDWSEFVENGVLRFQLRVDDYALHPTRQLQVSFETEGHNSNKIQLDENCSDGGWGWVEVPVKELITRADGTVDTTIIQNVKNALHLAPADIRGQDTLQGIAYRLINVTLQPAPGNEITEGYCQRN